MSPCTILFKQETAGHPQYIAAAAVFVLCTLLALSLLCCCHCTRGAPKPQLFRETAAERCKRITVGLAVSVFVIAALGMIDSFILT